MSIMISISAPDLDDESLQVLTRQLCQDLRNETDYEASLDTESTKSSSGSGAKSGGELEIIGHILIKAAGAGGALVALVNVIKSYVSRKPSLQVKIRKKNGDAIEINANDLRSDDMTILVRAIKQAFEEA